MIRVAIIGTGNLGTHLIEAIHGLNSDAGIEFVGYHSASGNSIPKLEDYAIPSIQDYPTCDICLLAVSDAAIGDVSKNLPDHFGIVAHTSGATSIKAIDKKHTRGVFWPLDSFSPKRTPNFSSIPICIEGSTKKGTEMLKKLAYSLSQEVHKLDGIARLKLHLAAVFANNFANQMAHEAIKIVEENNLPKDILKPIIATTALKLKELHPKDTQTGPAIRQDEATMNLHRLMLDEDPILKELYNQISKRIQEINE